jgi:hypothetical protein
VVPLFYLKWEMEILNLAKWAIVRSIQAAIKIIVSMEIEYIVPKKILNNLNIGLYRGGSY